MKDLFDEDPQNNRRIEYGWKAAATKEVTLTWPAATHTMTISITTTSSADNFRLPSSDGLMDELVLSIYALAFEREVIL